MYVCYLRIVFDSFVHFCINALIYHLFLLVSQHPKLKSCVLLYVGRVGLECLTPLSSIFQLYRDGQF
jgi:hypothetical protein